MSKAGYAMLQDVIMDPDFPDLDLALRRGRHVDRDDAAWYALLIDAQEHLENFYRRYGCELIHKTDGYFYLLPTGEKVSRKQLSATDMLVGQALALLYLDPAAIERGGVVTHEELVTQMSTVLGTDALIAAFHPSKRGKRFDERIAQRNVRSRVAEAARRLASMGFVELTDSDAVRLRSALLRFAEPVRGLSEPAEALAKLAALGEVALEPEQSDAEHDAAGEGDVHSDDMALGDVSDLDAAVGDVDAARTVDSAADAHDDAGLAAAEEVALVAAPTLTAEPSVLSGPVELVNAPAEPIQADDASGARADVVSALAEPITAVQPTVDGPSPPESHPIAEAATADALQVGHPLEEVSSAPESIALSDGDLHEARGEPAESQADAPPPQAEPADDRDFDWADILLPEVSGPAAAIDPEDDT